MNDKKLADVLNDLNRHDQDLQRQMVGTACRQAFQLYKAAVLDLVYALGERDGRLARAEAEVALLRGLVGQDVVRLLSKEVESLRKELAESKADGPHRRGNSAPTTNPRGEPCPASSAR